MKLLLALGWLLLSTLATGPKVIDSDIRFQISNAGLTVDGTLSGLEADLDFDPAHPEAAHLRASVPVSSIKTGIGLRDKHLQKPDYFDAERFPLLTLQSKAIRKIGPGKYEGTFDLTMKGSTHEVQLPFTVSAAHEFSGQLKVNRLDYGIGKKSLILSNDVIISLRVKLAAGS